MRASVITIVALIAVTTILVLDAREATAKDLPYPSGESIQQLEGLRTVLVVPKTGAEDETFSLIVVLHGLGGTATGMASGFVPWTQDGYMVCAPKSRGRGWTPDDIARVLRIAARLKRELPIDPAKVHVVGFSNGGWNLTPLAFDDDLHPCSATWIAAGFNGGKVPAWAKKGLGVLAMAGSEDGNADSARQTVTALRDKVRSVEVQIEEGLGHAYPRTLVPYHRWWMDVQEGRLEPGKDLGFDWKEDLDAAVASQEGVKKGGVLVWLYTTDFTDDESTRRLQHGVLFDPELRFLGRQIPSVKVDGTAQADRVAMLGVKSLPALVVLDKKGKVKKRFEGKIKASKVSRTLRGLVPNRRMP